GARIAVHHPRVPPRYTDDRPPRRERVHRRRARGRAGAARTGAQRHPHPGRRRRPRGVPVAARPAHAGGLRGAGRDRRAGGDRAPHADLPGAHFRTLDGLAVGSIGLGTYLGEEDDRIDRGYGQAIVDAVNSGCNLLDTAINYRGQRSERVIGQALVALEREGGFTREQMVVCTKGGYLPFEGGVPVDPGQYVRDTYVRTGILQPEDVVGGGHAMTPRYLEDQLGRSLRNLGLAAADVYYVHNPETQLGSVPRTEFLVRIRAAFEMLERQV